MTNRDTDIGDIVPELPGVAGHAYLDKFTEYMGTSLRADIATIAFLTDRGKNLYTASIWWDGKHVENFKYAIEKAPCAESISKDFCLYQSMLQTHFPEDGFIQEENLSSYVGFPLVNGQGEVFGVVNVVNRHELEPNSAQFTVMKNSLNRICAEAENYWKDWRRQLC